jgi:hypothetical protein
LLAKVSRTGRRTQSATIDAYAQSAIEAIGAPAGAKSPCPTGPAFRKASAAAIRAFRGR